jgi:hypothetical protein
MRLAIVLFALALLVPACLIVFGTKLGHLRKRDPGPPYPGL